MKIGYFLSSEEYAPRQLIDQARRRPEPDDDPGRGVRLMDPNDRFKSATRGLL
jgi:hypothetical protein